MEFEYKDTNRRGRLIVIAGVILALVAGGGAYYLVSQAQQQAGSSEVATAPVVYAVRTIPARKPIELADLAVRQVPADLVEAGAVADPNELVNRLTAVTVLEGQAVTSNLLASTAEGGQFSILKPEETVAPDSPYWRAVAITVPDERAVAGLVVTGSLVDVFMTATVNVPVDANGVAVGANGLYTDKSTKLGLQNVEVLAKVGTSYVIRVPVGVAEEIEHLLAAGNAQFSLALRPLEDSRTANASRLGATTNLIIERYGIPFPSNLATGGAYTGSATAFPIPTPAPVPAAAASPSPSPAP